MSNTAKLMASSPRLTRHEKKQLVHELKKVIRNIEAAVADIDLRGESEGISGSASNYITRALDKLETVQFEL